MKKLAVKNLGIAFLMLFGFMLVGCGGGPNSSGNINGNWTATLVDPTNNTGPVFAFTTSFTQSSNSGVNVTNLSFTTNQSCFGTAGTATGSFGLAGNFNGNVSGTFGMTIPSTIPSGNTLTLNGTVANNTITGTWTLAGPGCNGSGTFSMNKM